MPIVVVTYNKDWPSHFENIKAELTTALRDVSIISIEHIGSTSVECLSAKPIIDIDIIATEQNTGPAIKALEKVGYWYKGHRGFHGRWVLEDKELRPERRVYVCLEGCLPLRNHLAMRDVLRSDEGLRREYEKKKLELSGKGLELIEYWPQKSEIVLRILRSSGMFEEWEIEEIKEMNKVAWGWGVWRRD